MKLSELYAMLPAREHKNILVAEGKVYVRASEGTEEYVVLPDGELELVRSDKALLQDLARIKVRLGA